jgi:CBS domain containing-hemolysin-like protein
METFAERCGRRGGCGVSGSFSIVWVFLPVLLLVSAAVSAIETALFSLNPAERDRAGSTARKLLEDPQTLLISVLLANLVANVLYFACASGLAPADREYGELEYGFAALVVCLVFAEILPKTLALRAPVAVARAGAVPMSLFVAAIAPVRRMVQFTLDAFLRALGELAREERGITTESLAQVLEQSAQHGLIEDVEADLLAEVVELEGIRVREIMTPRVDMIAIDLTLPRDDAAAAVERALEKRLTWLPVIRGHADDVQGCVRLRDVLAQPDRPIASLVQKAPFIPEVAAVLDLLRVLRDRKATEAVVVDEYGGTAGIVTIEDIFEEIVGDLRVEGEHTPAPVTPLSDGRFRVSGSLSIRDWNEQFGREVVPDGFETVGGFVTALLGRIPRAGDRVRLGGLVSQVHEVRGRRVRSVDMYIEPAPEVGEGSTA